MDNDVHRSYPPPAPEDRVDGDLDDAADDGGLDGGPAETGSRGGGARHRLAPPTPDQRVELTQDSHLPWLVLVTLLGLAVAVYFFL